MKRKCKYKQGENCLLLGAGDLSIKCYHTDNEPCEDYKESED